MGSRGLPYTSVYTHGQQLLDSEYKLGISMDIIKGIVCRYEILKEKVNIHILKYSEGEI